MNTRSSMKHWLALPVSMALAALVACGGSEDAPPPSASVTVGAAGGTVDGPNGLQLVVPPGALAQPVVLSIAQTADGAPALPAGSTALGATFALTPHGTAFAIPVTVRVPFDPSLLPAGESLALWKTNAAQDAWQAVPGVTVSGNLVQAQINSFSWIIIVAPPVLPTIAVQPNPQSVVEPAVASFAVGASGPTLSGSLSFQWKRNGGPIAGATGITYSTGPTSVAADNGAVYSVDVTNRAGTVTSQDAILTVTPGPVAITITQGPVDASVAVGAGATFNVVAAGTAPTYQWERSDNAGAPFGAIGPAATGPSYTVTSAQMSDDGARFRVRVSNVVTPGGILSNVATLTITGGPPVSTTPQVMGGYLISYMLKRNGQVYRTSGGSGAVLTPVAIPGMSDVISIAAGSRHLLMLRANGSVWAWGDNLQGQLGDGTRTPRTTAPVEVITAATPIVAIAAGVFTSVALKSDGTLLEWGVDPSTGSIFTGLRLSPVVVPGLTNVVAITVAHGDPLVGDPDAIGHVLALRNDGTVWAWGYNGDGALGDGTRVSRATPAPVSSLSNVTMITAGERFSLARRSDDTVWGWGYNLEVSGGGGVLPGAAMLVRHTTPQLLDITPQPVPGLLPVDPTGPLTALVAGHDHVVALRGGYVLTWGTNAFGQLGINGVPVQVPSYRPAVAARPPNSVVAIGAGSDHSLAIDVNGNVWTWGYNNLGQLGDGTTTQRNAPVQVPGLNLN